MKSSYVGLREHHQCPENVVKELQLAGGDNPYGEPLFRVVWGWDRIVPMHGEWQEWGTYAAILTDKFTGYKETRKFTKLDRSVIETRFVPKYLPGNCWHLEMWRPPEEYGSPEEWKKLGEEVIGGLTINTSGPYPHRGEYELCYCLTSDGTSHGTPIPLVADVVSEIARMIIKGRGSMSYLQRRSAIEQRIRMEDEGYVKKVVDQLKDGLRPFAGNKFVTVPTSTGDKNESN
jgi:hypothetical protein